MARKPNVSVLIAAFLLASAMKAQAQDLASFEKSLSVRRK